MTDPTSDQQASTDGTKILQPNDSLKAIRLEDLSEKIQKAAARAGWRQLFPVQANTIPYLLADRELLIQSRTGSGKTGAFVLPIIDRIDRAKGHCQALVLVPTRELASQVALEAQTLAGDTGVNVISVYGGVGYGKQLEAFEKGAHLVVGTPGRVLDHLIRRSLNLDNLKMLVFDEADRMLSMGFYPDMKQVQGFLPSRHVSTFMFSATFPPYVIRLAGQFMKSTEILSLSQDHVHVVETEHVFYVVPAMEKDRCLVRIIETENPSSAIIFCNTKASTHYVSVVLKRFGYDADELSADLSQSAREKVLARVREGKLRFLVATDVAARGIDIPELSHVFLYEQPEDPEAYIHRSGRTGRAGATGSAVSLVAGSEQSTLMQIDRRFKIGLLEREMPTDEDVQAVVSERVTALLEARLRSRDSLQTERMSRFLPLAKSLGQQDDEAKVVAMLLDDYYQEVLHAPPSGPKSTQPPPKPSYSKGKKSGSRGRHRR